MIWQVAVRALAPASGYLALSDFNDLAGTAVAALVTRERVTGRGCAA